MSLIEIDKHPSRTKLRTFGLLLPLFVGFVGAVVRWRWNQPTAGLAVWIAGAALVIAYAVLPGVRRPTYVGWMYAVMPLGLFTSYVVLATTYFFILTPIGLVRRCFDDPLARRLDTDAATYWSPAKKRNDKRDYLRQF